MPLSISLHFFQNQITCHWCPWKTVCDMYFFFWLLLNVFFMTACQQFDDDVFNEVFFMLLHLSFVELLDLWLTVFLIFGKYSVLYLFKYLSYHTSSCHCSYIFIITQLSYSSLKQSVLCCFFQFLSLLFWIVFGFYFQIPLNSL